MEISITTEVELVRSNVVDSTPRYDQTTKLHYTKGLRLQDNDEIWERTGDSLLPPDFDVSKATSYKIGDVLWCSKATPDGIGGKVRNVVQVVDRMNTPVPKQPDLYANVEKSFDKFSAWSERYVLVKTGITGSFDGFIQDSGGYTHRLFKDKASPTKWTYEVVTHEKNAPYFEDSLFSIPDELVPNADKTYVKVVQAAGKDTSVEVWYKNKKVGSYDHVSSPIVPNQTTFTATVSAGGLYLVGDLERAQEDANRVSYRFYRVAKQNFRDVDTIQSDHASVTTFLTANTVEPTAYYCGVGSSDPNYNKEKDTVFILRSFVLRGDKLYARTQAQAVQETTTSTQPVLAEVKRLADFKSGWTFVSPTEKYKPFDGKSYTKIHQSGEATFVFRVPAMKFNTIAFTKVIADSIDVKVTQRDGGGTVFANIAGIKPNGSRDAQGRLPQVGTTQIVYINAAKNKYTDVPAGSWVYVTLKGQKIELGGIFVGLSVDAGFTNLVFSNKYKDYSPYEKDQWGNVTYIDGVKVNIHSGTVDVPIRQYDMMNRLITSFGQGLVILNGSDSLDNTPPDNNELIFASTMVVGRITNFELKTRLDNKSMGQMATYSFTITEEV